MNPIESCLTEVATAQAGYFTAGQARVCGYSYALLSHHAATGRFVRAKRGLYRLRDYPSSLHEDVMAAWLAAGAQAVVSHESALDLLGVGDSIPNRIHITVPRSKRGSHRPKGVVVHTSERPPDPEDVVLRSGIRVTAPVRTIIDVARAGLGPDLVSNAARQIINRGLATSEQLRSAANLQGGRVWRMIRELPAEGTL
jgi:predicted transcriptional regulator of viral defense system